MENIFHIIDIWLNIIPHVDYRTFCSIKRLNKVINRDCYIKRKPLIEDLKNWEFYLESDEIPQKVNENNSEWKKIKNKTGKNKSFFYKTDIAYIERVKTLDYDGFINLLATYLPYGYRNKKLEYYLSMLIVGDTVKIKMYDKYYNFYYNGIDYTKMKLTHNNSGYIYPEHILQIVGYDLNKFFHSGKHLVNVSKFYDNDHINNPWYGYSNGLHGPCSIGICPCANHYSKYKNILINDTITLKASDDQIIYIDY